MMHRKLFIIIALAILCSFYISGCDKTSSDNESDGDVVVKTQAEYEAEAEELTSDDLIKMIFDKVELVVKSRYGKFAETGGSLESC